ncbi:MAG: V-type ATP synthase subunit D [Candidatus Thermoplasmatota archaeon]|nr:V-type ATP synthase subunit D [Candidatus Thermoplasmatota archaeon]MDI6855759.1 V-type ATP synthase subunit D [Candidatus Thermoplasmatota archaeon]
MIATTAKLTRMELLTTKKKLKLAIRGHKLLKDKRDELMKHFLAVIKETKRMREGLEEELENAYKEFMLVRATASMEELENAFLYPRSRTTIEATTKTLVGVEVPELKLNLSEVDLGYSLAQTPIQLDTTLAHFRHALQKLALLAQLQSSSELLALEIERTRRRVNALEHILIPQLERKVKYIELRLEEVERANFCNLMRIKDIVRRR